LAIEEPQYVDAQDLIWYSVDEILQPIGSVYVDTVERPQLNKAEQLCSKERRTMFKKILLAIDGSRDAAEATRYAQELALRDDAQVFVVHVIPSVPMYLGDPWQQEAISQNAIEGEKITEPVARQLREAGVDVVVEMLEGSPADGILRVANVREPDLIVMGSRGHGDLTSLLLGSVSHRVLAHTRVPVMITKASEKDIE